MNEQIPLGEYPDAGSITLSEFAALIAKWQRKYGVHAILKVDAGYNNISADIIPTKKQ